jgi:D-alanyl-D-alanine carboxypeptidase/D-alanyl-D-alanine-endopeptidase (penicillin-binding protein 4)
LVAGALLSLAVAACSGGASSSVPGSAPEASRPAVPAAPAVPHELAVLQHALRVQLHAAGPNSAAEVFDLGDGQVLYAADDRQMRPPASLEKLYTTVALLERMGSDARLHTQLLGTGHLGPGGVWHGDLYLHGEGDPTFGDTAFDRAWDGGQGATSSDLVSQLSARGIHAVTGRVIGDPSLFDSHPGGPASGLAPDIADLGGQLAGLTYDHGATSGMLSPGAFAARELVLTMRAAHIRAQAAPVTGQAPPDAQPLASAASPPLSELVRLMDVPSDDFFAEMLTKQLGAQFGAGGSIEAGAGVISSVIARRYGLHPVIVDGSGLSRQDRSSPSELVHLLRVLRDTPTGHTLIAALPQVGVNGTTRHIGVGTVAQGRCVAKTGTLDDVTNLAGYCHADRGHELAFAVFLDGPDNHRGIQLLSRMVAAMVRY